MSPPGGAHPIQAARARQGVRERFTAPPFTTGRPDLSPDEAHGRKGRTLTRSDLVDALPRDTGLHRDDCAAALEHVLGTIIDRLDNE